MLRGINHAGITVADLDRSLAFYRDVLGLEVQLVFERSGEDISRIVGYPDARLRIAMLHIPGGPARIELLQYLNPGGTPGSPETCNPGVGHVCFNVDDIHSWYERVKSAGAECRSDGPVEIVQGPHRGVFVMYLRDPDGYTIELFQPAPAG